MTKAQQREEIARLMVEYIARGGIITSVKPGRALAKMEKESKQAERRFAKIEKKFNEAKAS